MTGMMREMGVWLRMNNEESIGGLKEERENLRENLEHSHGDFHMPYLGKF